MFYFSWLNILSVGIVDISLQSAGTGKYATPTMHLNFHFAPLAVSYERFPQWNQRQLDFSCVRHMSVTLEVVLPSASSNFQSFHSGIMCSYLKISRIMAAWQLFLRKYNSRGVFAKRSAVYYWWVRCVHAPIHVLSRDGQSISGSWQGSSVCLWPSMYSPRMVGMSGYSDRGLQCACTYPCTVLRWSVYLRISGYSDGGEGGHAPIHVLSQDGQSISGYSDKEGWYDLAQCMYI